uniref:Glutaredoxin domain-containing protein n=1 Tax=Globisporangium ultimum (strain ATCC 200006 / CBS 805.95 / DAOM BR144) TaxID=431595 RepID=K3W6N6_GLOUD
MECVILISSTVSIAEQKHQIQQTLQILDGNRIMYRTVDCADEGNKDARDVYFERSGIRANYPQVFLVPGGDQYSAKYIGSFAEIQQLNEMSDVPKEILEANNIPTLESVFVGVPRKS